MRLIQSLGLRNQEKPQSDSKINTSLWLERPSPKPAQHHTQGIPLDPWFLQWEKLIQGRYSASPPFGTSHRRHTCLVPHEIVGVLAGLDHLELVRNTEYGWASQWLAFRSWWLLRIPPNRGTTLKKLANSNSSQGYTRQGYPGLRAPTNTVWVVCKSFILLVWRLKDNNENYNNL